MGRAVPLLWREAPGPAAALGSKEHCHQELVRLPITFAASPADKICGILPFCEFTAITAKLCSEVFSELIF